MTEQNVDFWQTPLFIFSLTIIAGLIGFFLRYYVELRRSKRLKIRSIELITAMKYATGDYVTPSLNIKLENLSKVDIKINYVSLKSKERISMASIDMVPVRKENNQINILELKSFKYICCKTLITQNPQTRMIAKTTQVKLSSPTDFFNLLYSHLNPKSKPIKNRKHFKKRLKTLGVLVNTNIGVYFRKFTKKERKMFYMRAMLEEYDKAFPE